MSGLTALPIADLAFFAVALAVAIVYAASALFPQLLYGQGKGIFSRFARPGKPSSLAKDVM